MHEQPEIAQLLWDFVCRSDEPGDDAESDVDSLWVLIRSGFSSDLSSRKE